MRIIRGLRKLKPVPKGSVVTIGVFDGLHRGHREIINKVTARAKQLNLKSVVVTFDPHPLKVLNPKSGSLSLISLDHRINLIKELGVDILVILKFTSALAKLSPEAFVKNVLIDPLAAKEVYVSDNFYFGRGGRADAMQLKALASGFGLKTVILKPVKISDAIVSSSLIRKFIMSGNLRKAQEFLGRPVSLLGSVVSGSKLARRLGYPTANINPHHEVIPPSGVYAVRVRFKNRLFKGVLNIGTKPTFYSSHDREPTVEVHIFNFDKRIYGKTLEILFVRKLRGEAKFKASDELVSQIKRDEIRARSILRLYKF